MFMVNVGKCTMHGSYGHGKSPRKKAATVWWICGICLIVVHPGKSTWNLKITCLKGKSSEPNLDFQLPCEFSGVYIGLVSCHTKRLLKASEIQTTGSKICSLVDANHRCLEVNCLSWRSGTERPVDTLPETNTRWWFQIFFIFTATWGNDPIWLVFFKWVETTN